MHIHKCIIMIHNNYISLHTPINHSHNHNVLLFFSYDKQELIRLHRASNDPEEKKLIQSQIDKHRDAENMRKNKHKKPVEGDKNVTENVPENMDFIAMGASSDSEGEES